MRQRQRGEIELKDGDSETKFQWHCLSPWILLQLPVTLADKFPMLPEPGWVSISHNCKTLDESLCHPCPPCLFLCGTCHHPLCKWFPNLYLLQSLFPSPFPNFQLLRSPISTTEIIFQLLPALSSMVPISALGPCTLIHLGTPNLFCTIEPISTKLSTF